MNGDLAALVVWALTFASNASGLDWPGAPTPYVKQADKGECRLTYDDSVADYSPRTNTICLGKGLDPRSPRGKSTLIHEAVHFLQDLHKVPHIRCVDPRSGRYIGSTWEKEAYRVQDTYRLPRGLGSAVSPQQLAVLTCAESLAEHRAYLAQ